MKKRIELDADPEYWKLSKAEKKAICNGAGPRRFGWLVPDWILLVCITEAANIHDYDYSKGGNGCDKQDADLRFLVNMTRIILGKNKWEWLTKKRIEIAVGYYEAVRACGGRWFKGELI